MSAAPSKMRPMHDEPIVTVRKRADGVAVVTLDDKSATLNTIGPAFGEELIAAIDRVLSDETLLGAVVVSGKRDSFVVGANVEMLTSLKLASDAEGMARAFAKELTRVRAQKKPIVAAVHGAALGGGFEIALGCHAIVATDDPKTTFGLPEVQLGLLPAANGMMRVAERAGLKTAIDLALTGRSLRAARAKKMGLVDDVCAPEILLEVACERVKALAKPDAKQRRTSGLARHWKDKDLAAAALEDNPFGRALLFKKAREEARAKTKGHYPAPERILDVLEKFARRGFAAAADLEARAFGDLVVSETAHRLVELFFATTALKKDTGVDDIRVKPRAVERVSIIGGGLMGAGIAYVTIAAGMHARVKDKDDAGAGRALSHVRDLLGERFKRRSGGDTAREEYAATLSRLTASTDYSGLRHADVVIEAVFEDLALKQQVLRDVEAAAPKECIFASNTSSIPITTIAQASKHPETVVGMHYFSPVNKMPLLEVVRTEKTAPWVVATAVALGKKQGKTVIVVGDGVGFYTSRVLAPYMNEAAYLLSEGVSVDAIDRALVDWGWPVGPIQLLDEVGIDVAAHVGEIVHAAFGARMVPPSGMKKLAADDRKGRKNRRGFYKYDGASSAASKKSAREVDPTVYAALGVDTKKPSTKLPAEEIQMRCSLQMVNEAILCLESGVLRSPRDGDVGAVLGLGFPPFRGGPFRYVDTLGASEVLRRMRSYEMRFGARFTPAPSLVDMARRGGRFYGD